VASTGGGCDAGESRIDKMKRSFIVDYILTGDTDLNAIAEDIKQDLLTMGHDVTNVKPFAPKGAAAPAALPFNPNIQPT
jgi:hypothetical protein